MRTRIPKRGTKAQEMLLYYALAHLYMMGFKLFEGYELGKLPYPLNTKRKMGWRK